MPVWTVLEGAAEGKGVMHEPVWTAMKGCGWLGERAGDG